MRDRKRILFISNLFPNPMSPNMASYNHQLIMALHNYHDIDVVAPIAWIKRFKYSIPLHRQDNGIDIYHPTYFYPPGCLRSLYGYFFQYSIRNSISTLVSKWKYDIVLAAWMFPDGYAATQIAKELNIPVFVKALGTDVNRLHPDKILTRLTLGVVENSNGISCVSQALKTRLEDLGAPSEKLSVQYNGIDKNIFHPLCREKVRQKLNINLDDTLVLYVGNLIKEKGLNELISAFKIVSDQKQSKWKLVIIGKGPLKKKIIRDIDQLILSSKVRLMGSLSLGEIAIWMNAATMLCLPSYSEGMPNVIMEALSCGTKIVASNVGGIPELCYGNKEFRMVSPRNIEQLAVALKEMAIQQPEVGETLFVVDTWDDNALKLEKVLFGEN